MSLSESDKKYVWHPYTNLGLEQQPIVIARAKGAYLFDENGKRYIDAISSWWTNIHGHAHPYIAQKIYEQAQQLEHVIFAGFTHEPAIMLAKRLLDLLPSGRQKIFFSDNGSTAVEVALKMAFQFWHNKGNLRSRVIAFKNAYHGDTFGAMSVSGRSTFTRVFEKLLFEVSFIDPPLPGMEEESLEQLDAFLARESTRTASFIFEPLVQGTAGMLMHNAAMLNRMIDLCRKYGVITIADEVMTGFGRTGKMFASDYLSAKPDIFCLSKGVTGGAMALGITSCTQAIYEAFLSADSMKTFFHGHSYTANPLACAAASASLDLFEMENTMENIQRISSKHQQFVMRLANPEFKQLNIDVRHLGTLLALEIKTGESTSYFNALRSKIYSWFIERGILIRPLGNVLYLMPPYCISSDDLDYIYESISGFLISLINKPRLANS